MNGFLLPVSLCGSVQCFDRAECQSLVIYMKEASASSMTQLGPGEKSSYDDSTL